MSVGKDTAIKVRCSKSFPYFFWHVCSQSPFYALGSIISAHVSTFSLTSAQPNLNICFEWHSVCTHLPEGAREHAEHEYYFLIFYCISACYRFLLFVLRILGWRPDILNGAASGVKDSGETTPSCHPEQREGSGVKDGWKQQILRCRSEWQEDAQNDRISERIPFLFLALPLKSTCIFRWCILEH